MNGRKRSFPWSRLWRPWRLFLLALAIAPVVSALIGIVQQHGLVFTRRSAIVGAAWLLLLVTIILDLLVQGMEPTDREAAATEAANQADAMTKDAVQAADQMRTATSAGRRKVSRSAESPAVEEAVLRAHTASSTAVSAAAASVSAAVDKRRIGLKALVVGTDGRTSTSKVQAVLWSYAVLFAFAYMLLLGRVLVGGSHAPRLGGLANSFLQFASVSLQPEYVAMLGLPIAGAVAAKALTTGKTAREELLKPPSDKSGIVRGVAEVVTDDNGQADLLDFQYAAFNLIALAYFFTTFVTVTSANPGEGLPAIPPTLLALSGVSTVTYVTKKAMESGVGPIVTAVTPMSIRLGVDGTIDVQGSGFPQQGHAETQFNQVLLGGRPLAVHTPWADNRVVAMLPGTADGVLMTDGYAELLVRDDVGTSSPSVRVKVG